MAEITHDLADDGFHEIHLSGKQLVFLFMATTVVAVVIFLCGVQVGRSVPIQRAQEQFTDPTPTPTASAAPATAPPVASTGPAAVEPPQPPAEADELSYKKRLEGAAAPKESLRPVTEPPPARTPPPAARPQPTTPPPAPASAPLQTAATTPPQSGTWVLQVHALRDAKVANGIVQRLAKKGYPAYIAASGAPTSMYRVLVGRYKDRAEAERVAERLKKEEQFNPWITR